MSEIKEKSDSEKINELLDEVHKLKMCVFTMAFIMTGEEGPEKDAMKDMLYGVKEQLQKELG